MRGFKTRYPIVINEDGDPVYHIENPVDFKERAINGTKIMDFEPGFERVETYNHNNLSVNLPEERYTVKTTKPDVCRRILPMDDYEVGYEDSFVTLDRKRRKQDYEYSLLTDEVKECIKEKKEKEKMKSTKVKWGGCRSR